MIETKHERNKFDKQNEFVKRRYHCKVQLLYNLTNKRNTGFFSGD